MADVVSKAPTREQIAERAYELYLERGAGSGYDVADWLTAEKELFADCTTQQDESTNPPLGRRQKGSHEARKPLKSHCVGMSPQWGKAIETVGKDTSTAKTRVRVP